MNYQLKKEHLTNWDVPEVKNRLSFNGKSLPNNDQDTYISERSSAVSLNENNSVPSPNNKQTPPSSLPRTDIPKKQPHTLRYSYNELPENGIPLATQYRSEKKEAKKIKKPIPKAPPGQGTLAPLPEVKPSGTEYNYYPYWYYYKVKNPDWILRHRQTADGRLIPYDPVDPSQYVHPPATTESAINSRRHQRKVRYQSPITQHNPQTQHYETAQKISSTSYKNYGEQNTSPRQYIPLKDTSNMESTDQSTSQISSQQRNKLQTERDWNEHYVQSFTNKSPQNSNYPIIPSKTPIRRSKHSKNTNSHSTDESIMNHHHHHHHRHHNHHRHHRHHHHHHHSPPQSEQQQHYYHQTHHDYLLSKEYVDSTFQVVDASFKKSERTPYFQHSDNPPSLPPPAIYNQNSYLPPLMVNNYNRLDLTNAYGIRRLSKDWRDSLKLPETYKTDSQTKFYDRYLNNVIDKKLAA